jgi:hypothetical protein
VVAGEILEGVVRIGMVLLTTLEDRPNVYVSLPVRAVEVVDRPGGTSLTGLLIADAQLEAASQNPDWTEGHVLDVLEREPTA